MFTPSVAPIVWVPCGTAGIETAQEKLPVGAEEQIDTADTPSRVKVIVLDAANPVPVAVVVLPTIPLVGFNSNNAVTVNDAEARFVPSEAFNVCAPFGVAGIATVHEKLPFVRDAQAEVAALPSKVKVMDTLAANPIPVAVVVLPTLPTVGLSERDAFTVNVAGA